MALHTLPQVAELSGKAEHTRDFAIMPAVSSSATPSPIVGHDKQTTTITLVLSASNHPEPTHASPAPITPTPHLQPTPGAQRDTAAPHNTHHHAPLPHRTATASAAACTSISAPASTSAPAGAAPALARTLSAPSSLSSMRDVTIVGKDIAAKLGMRVEMRETALAKARGAGVLTSVSRKGRNSQKYYTLDVCIL